MLIFGGVKGKPNNVRRWKKKKKKTASMRSTRVEPTVEYKNVADVGRKDKEDFGFGK